MKKLLPFILAFGISLQVHSQTYTETIDTFYVPSPEYSVTLGVDSLHFPCAITRPDLGSSFPVLILVHGSSSVDKDANATKDYRDSIGAPTRKAATRMFYEIADSLSRNGIMVLRYDKRSYTVNCIEKPPCWWADTITPYDYIKDILYAVEFAKTLPGIDTCNIFLAGHSQGGSFVADLGYKRNDIRGVIALAPTAQPVDSVVVFQTLTMDSDPVGAAIIRDQFDSLRAGLWPATDTLYNQVFSPRFWLDWIQITDSAVITQQLMDIPTLFMYGTDDAAVPPSIHMNIWMDSISRPDVSFQTFNDLDHSFGTIYDSTISPAVLDSLSTWIHNNSLNCSVVGTFDELKEDIPAIFPNPTWGEVRVNAVGLKPYAEIWSLNGKKLGSIPIVEGRVEVSHLSCGVFILRIFTESGPYITKIVKM